MNRSINLMHFHLYRLFLLGLYFFMAGRLYRELLLLLLLLPLPSSFSHNTPPPTHESRRRRASKMGGRFELGIRGKLLCCVVDCWIMEWGILKYA
ncbi:hypothetical protein F4859DRAFT_477096 [Xylaria cf. heliscus]|nr:hypothetical protein F4859DRAFT_477096 [Xylaria cf. heliscus]